MPAGHLEFFAVATAATWPKALPDHTDNFQTKTWQSPEIRDVSLLLRDDLCSPFITINHTDPIRLQRKQIKTSDLLPADATTQQFSQLTSSFPNQDLNAIHHRVPQPAEPFTSGADMLLFDLIVQGIQLAHA